MQLCPSSHDSYVIVRRKERKVVRPSVVYAIHCAGLSREHSSLLQSPFPPAKEEKNRDHRECWWKSSCILSYRYFVQGELPEGGNDEPDKQLFLRGHVSCIQMAFRGEANAHRSLDCVVPRRSHDSGPNGSWRVGVLFKS